MAGYLEVVKNFQSLFAPVWGPYIRPKLPKFGENLGNFGNVIANFLLVVESKSKNL